MLALVLVLVVVPGGSADIDSRFNSVREVVVRNASITDRMISHMTQFADLGHRRTYRDEQV